MFFMDVDQECKLKFEIVQNGTFKMTPETGVLLKIDPRDRY